MHGPAQNLGRITTVSGSGASARLFKNATGQEQPDSLTIGRLVGLHVESSLVVGVVTSMTMSMPEPGDDESGHLVAAIDFMGEIKNYDTDTATFQRGVSNYPTIGDAVSRLQTADIAVIHRIDTGDTIDVGGVRIAREHCREGNR